MHSSAKTVEEYLAELPEDRRGVISALRDAILEVLPAGYEEAMNWGMITYQVPLETYSDTYNKQPLMLVGLAAQKNHFALYLMPPYMFSEEDSFIRESFRSAGKNLDMGKSCIRFNKLEDIELQPILDVIARTDLSKYIGAAKTVKN